MVTDEPLRCFFKRPPWLVAPCDRFELAEPLPKTSFCNLSIRCFETSAVFAALTDGAAPPNFAPAVDIRHIASRLPALHHSSKRIASKTQWPRGPHGWLAPGIRPSAASFLQCRPVNP